MSPTAKRRKQLAEEDPEIALGYRRPMRVCEVMIFPAMRGSPGWPVCPRCEITMEREYMAYCDRCGQCLDWHDYKHAKIIFPLMNRTVE